MDDLGRGYRRLAVVLTAVLVGIAGVVMAPATAAHASILPNSAEVTYKEYWVPHSQYTAGCPELGTQQNPPVFYDEPGPCTKNLNVTIPDNFSQALKVEVYIDLWRESRNGSPVARFTINGGVQRSATVGADWSRTPYLVEIPASNFVQGVNTFAFAASPPEARYHIHDLAVRIYYDAAHPLIAGPGSDVTPPTASLLSVGGLNPAAGGTLNVDNDQVAIQATANDASYLDVIGYYDGYDETNSGETLAWHAANHNNWNPGGMSAKPTGGTIDDIGTIATPTNGGTYAVTWNLPDVANQSGVMFKVRAVDAAGNVREAAGGVSAPFTLTRSVSTEVYRIPNFQDAGIHQNGANPDTYDASIDLPDLTNVTSVTMDGAFWNNPFISMNGNTAFKAFNSTCDTCGEDTWSLSRRTVPIAQLVPGTNTIRYSYNSQQSQFGQMVEKPGPMFLIKRATGTGAPQIVNQPSSIAALKGNSAIFSVVAKGAAPLTYQWLRNGVAIAGATSPTLSLAAVADADNQAKYTVQITNGSGSITSAQATLTVVGSGPWWDQRWDFRLPVFANAGSYARSDAIVESDVDFTKALHDGGSGGPLDPSTIRVVEVDATGALVDDTVISQFEPGSSFDALNHAVGHLVLRAAGSWAAGTNRYFEVYFDVPGGGGPPLAGPGLVSVANDTDQGQASYRIATQNATYEYQQQGASLSSLVDNNGNNWISYNPTTGSAGAFRGVPNFPYPEGDFHPGFTNSTSQIVSSGPLRVVVQSKSNDGKWAYTTAFYPQYAVSTVTKVDAVHKYWFLYEGTPGGVIKPNQVVVRSNGTQTAIGTSWSGAITGDEWAYVGDPDSGRSFYMASNTADNLTDSYFLLENNMTVLGFGRDNSTGTAQMLIPEANRSFTFGLVDTTTYGTAKPVINGSYKPIAVNIGKGERDLGPVLSPDVNALTVSPSDVTATVSWTTGSPSTGTVEYGSSPLYGLSVGDPALKPAHSVSITGLTCATTYHFHLVSSALATTSTTPDGTFRTAACTPQPIFTGDDFSPAPLNSSLWSLVDPVGGGSAVSDGTNAVLTVPGGVDHDAWTGTNKAVRIMQPVTGIGNFTLEAKFLDVPSKNDQMTGFLVQETPTKFVRFDLLYNSNSLKLFAGFVNGATGTALRTLAMPTQAGPVWVRVTRSGSSWTMSWSNDGTNFTAAAAVTAALSPTTIGVFAANHNATPANTPAFTSRLGYVIDTSAPIVPEGGPDTTGPAISGVGIAAHANDVVVSWTTDEPSTTRLDYGPTSDYGQTLTIPGLLTRHSVTVPIPTCQTAIQIGIESDDDWSNVTRLDGLSGFSTACLPKIFSDDFNGPTLLPGWVVYSPNGDVPATHLTGTDAVFDLPAGSVHDLIAPNFAAHRLLQYSPNTDFEIEEKWETLPSARFQNEGLLVQADASNLVRFEVYHNGTQLRLFAGTMTNGVLTTQLDTAISASASVVLRAKRAGDLFTMSYALDGGPLTQAIQFTQALTVADVGAFVANSNTTPSTTPAFAAELDYFHNVADNLPDADTDVTPPTITNFAVTATKSSALATWDTDEPATSVIDVGSTTVYGTTITDSKKVLHHAVTVPGLTCAADYHLRATSADLAQAGQSGDAMVTTSACPVIVSDNFNLSTLNSMWTYQDPKGDAPGPRMTGTDAAFDLPQGSRHDLTTGALEAPRLLQSAPNTDVAVAAAWRSVPSQNTQIEGLLAQQDPSNFLRFDVFSDGTSLHAFAGTAVNGILTTRANSVIPAATRIYQRLTRTGNSWKLEWSPDNITWNTLTTLTFALTLNDIGAFAGNSAASGSPPAWSAVLDSFDNVTAPAPPDDATPPVLSGISAAASASSVSVQWTTDEPASSKVDYGLNTSYGQSAQDTTLVTAHVLSFMFSCGTTVHYRVVSTDVHGNTATGSDQTVATQACAAGIQSDAFGGATLDPRWTFVNPVGDVPAPTMTGTEVRLDIPAGTSHDLWTGELRAPMLVQSAPDTDFQIETKWTSGVTQANQMEGMVVRQSPTTFIRFDVFQESATTRKAFAATFVNGVATARANVATTISGPVYERVTRAGSAWTYQISGDGSTWTTIANFTFALTVTDVGAFAGNHNSVPANSPAFSAILDYFNNNANPLPDDTPPPVGIRNDDFQTFDASKWTFVNPRGDATLQVTGGNAVVTMPGGSGHDHDAVNSALTVPRLQQTIANTNFETELKFSSNKLVANANQIEGLLVRQSDSKWIRFDTFTNKDHNEVYAATWDGTNFVERVRTIIRGGSDFYVRVRRTSDTWMYWYSYDQLRWTPATTFNFALQVATMGPFFGNVPKPGQALSTTPAFTGKVDYVVNRLSPPSTEDGAPFPPPAGPPAINVWYGDNQTFGQNGKPQQWVDLLGDVSDYNGVASLTYSLNAGASQPLSMGENNARLSSPGDFDAEIDYASLLPGANTVVITAVDALGNPSSHLVTINNAYTGQAWPRNYSINWSSVANINDAAQIIAGQWNKVGNTVRTATTGYDRTIAIGDQGWSGYDATVQVTAFSLDPRENGVGIVAGWRGATTDNYGVSTGDQPRLGHPFPALGWYSLEVGRTQKLNIYRNFAPTYETRLVQDPSFVLSLGVTYNLKMEVAPINSSTSQYSIKIWEVGTSEPAAWRLTAQSARQDGSIVLGAHRSDVAFGPVTVTPLGSDTTPPVISNVNAAVVSTGANVTWTTNENADSRVEYGPTASYGSAVTDSNLVVSHNLSVPGGCGATVHYRVVSADAFGNTSSTPDATFATPSCPAIRSDGFNGATLDPGWTFISPKGDVAAPVMTGTDAQINLPAGSSHDLWTNALNAPMIVESAPNTDFQIQTKWDSTISSNVQMQGIVVRQDATNFLRFDVYSNGVLPTKVFVARFTNGVGTQIVNSTTTATNPVYQRVTRTGNAWTYEISSDGSSWSTLASFTWAMTVTQVGAFAGNNGTTATNAPAFAAKLDYFWNTATPLP
jgi:regulation of enolase protein 1 (concanavalin A-like superfamily)